MQHIIPFSLTQNNTKSSFIEDGNNHLIYQLDTLLKHKNLNIFIYGHIYGKTHLMQAYSLLALEQKLHALYLNLKNSSPLLNILRELELDILFLDNLEFATLEMQQVLFDLYNSNICIALTANKDNNELKLLQDLNTRINKSIKLEINDLSDENKLTILMNNITENNLNIKPKHIKYLFVNYSRDLKKLIKTTHYIQEQSLVKHTKISTRFIKKILIE